MKIQNPKKPKNVCRLEKKKGVGGFFKEMLISNPIYDTINSGLDKKLGGNWHKKKSSLVYWCLNGILLARFCIAVWGACILTHNQPAKNSCFFILWKFLGPWHTLHLATGTLVDHTATSLAAGTWQWKHLAA